MLHVSSEFSALADLLAERAHTIGVQELCSEQER